MADLHELIEEPALDGPVLILALEGWIDAGMGASNSMSAVTAGVNAETVATFDPDRLIDHRARRPVVHLVNGLITGLDWPSIELRAGSDVSGNDVLLLVGAEPDFEWHGFTEAVVDLAQSYGSRMAVSLGAYPAPVPHTRDASLAVTTSSPDLSDQLRGYVRGTLDVPGGIHSVLDVALNDVGVPSLGLWAQVPHYVSGMPYPAAALTLLNGLHEIAGLTIPTGQLPSDAKATRIRLDELVAQNSQHQAMVTQLEEMADQGLGGPESEVPIFGFDRIPSGDELAAELQEFLRQHPDES